MSFDRLPSLESQPTTMRRGDDPHYSDDPDFQVLAKKISSNLFTLSSLISKLSTQSGFLGTKRETERVRERIKEFLDDTTKGFKDVGEDIKKLQAWEDVNPTQKYTQQKLSREFQASLREYQVIQRSTIEKEKASASAARAAIEEASSGDQSKQSPGGQQMQLQEQEQLRLASQEEVDFQDSLIVERESEIRNIEQSVGELNELFRDVAHIVGEQGQQLDIISENVENVRTDTRGADIELRSASRYQRNSRNKACCLLLILAVILTIILLAVFMD